MVFFQLMPTILIFFIVLLNVSKLKFAPIEIMVGATLVYAIVLIVTLVVMRIPAVMPVSDILGNLTLAGCLVVLTYKKTKNVLLSGHYVLLTLVIGMIGNTIAGIPILMFFDATIEDFRNSLILHIIVILPTIIICHVMSKYMGNRLNQDYSRLSFDIKKKYAIYGFYIYTVPC